MDMRKLLELDPLTMNNRSTFHAATILKKEINGTRKNVGVFPVT